MERQAFKDEIKFRLTGGVLQLELDEAALDQVLNAAFREIQRYIDTTKIVTLPFQRCIDLSGAKVSAVTHVMRASPRGTAGGAYTSLTTDPMIASMWQIMSNNNNMYNFSDYVLNYASYSTLQQIGNTASTDMAYYYDKTGEKLYINILDSVPTQVTLEFIPRLDDVSEIVSDYWIDMTIRLAVALAKVTIGRIRSRYTQTNAIWGNDGERMLDEGNTELTALRDLLASNDNLTQPID